MPRTTASQRYRQKLSGPLLDRIDLRLAVPRLTKHELMGDARRASPRRRSATRVEAARARQRRRYAALAVSCNAHLPGPLDRAGSATLDARRTRHARRARSTGWRSPAAGSTACCKVARTVADLAGADRVDAEHVAEALAYRTAFEHEDEAIRAAAG